MINWTKEPKNGKEMKKMGGLAFDGRKGRYINIEFLKKNFKALLLGKTSFLQGNVQRMKFLIDFIGNYLVFIYNSFVFVNIPMPCRNLISGLFFSGTGINFAI